MDVTPFVAEGTPIIQGYKNGVLRVSGASYDKPIMLSKDGVQDWDGSFDNLPQHDVLIVGTGATQIWPDAKTRATTPMEVMNTPAACRTYNALITDGRSVLALLHIVQK